jgi:hypothetical protein
MQNHSEEIIQLQGKIESKIDPRYLNRVGRM